MPGLQHCSISSRLSHPAGLLITFLLAVRFALYVVHCAILLLLSPYRPSPLRAPIRLILRPKSKMATCCHR